MSTKSIPILQPRVCWLFGVVGIVFYLALAGVDYAVTGNLLKSALLATSGIAYLLLITLKPQRSLLWFGLSIFAFALIFLFDVPPSPIAAIAFAALMTAIFGTVIGGFMHLARQGKLKQAMIFMVTAFGILALVAFGLIYFTIFRGVR